jgi:hypothetical protein
MKVDLSIDFDFFIKEDPMWDFGHNESILFLNFSPLWQIRYADYDLVKETDTWKRIGDDGGTKKVPYKIIRWDDLPKGNYEIQRIFLCRSGCWTAPHHDETFNLFAFILSMNCKGRNYIQIGEIDPLEERKIDWESVRQFKEQLDSFKEDLKKKKEEEKNGK